MSWNQNLEILSSNVWGKDAESTAALPKDAVALCAYELFVMAILDMDQIAYIRQTARGDELWMVTEETPYENPNRASADEIAKLEILLLNQSRQAMRVLTMTHTDSILRSGIFLLSEYFDAVCGLYSPVKFLAKGLLLRHDYEEINERQNDTIRKNQAAARKRKTKSILNPPCSILRSGQPSVQVLVISCTLMPVRMSLVVDTVVGKVDRRT